MAQPPAKRVQIQEEIQSISSDPAFADDRPAEEKKSFYGAGKVQSVQHSAVTFTGGVRSSTRQSVTGRMSMGGKVRESYAAALWNPLSDADKFAFNRSRLLQLFCGVMIGTCAGSSFAFGIFSNKIKETAQLSQSDMATITTTGSIMQSFTFPAGILFDYFGPNYVMFAATILSCSGFGMLALIFQGVIPATVYTVAISKGMSAIGSGFYDCGALMANLFNFPVNRGDVLIIQKTFFGLGSTFFSIIFDGFFGPTDDYIGYAVAVTIVMFISGVAGTIFVRLPPYKRSIRDLKRIEKLDEEEKEKERQAEERAFEMYHNPRLSDRRRLNAGIACLLFSLAFFSFFSIMKSYIELPRALAITLTIVAILCIVSFITMVSPFTLPAFFDFDFLPDLNPPEALVDKPGATGQTVEAADADDDEKKEYTINNFANGTGSRNPTVTIIREDDVNSVSGGREYLETDGLARRSTIGGHPIDQDGRASSFFPTRSSVAGTSAPIALPEGIAPNVVPSIATPFIKSLTQPMLWCMWIIGFTKASVAVIVVNQAQIMNSANDGQFNKRNNSLAVALLGIGSGIGRICIGAAESYFQKKNALLREAQLAWEAEHGPAPEEMKKREPQPGELDMRPVYHRYNSTVVCLFPYFPAVLVLCVFSFAFAPVDAFPFIFVPLGAAHGGWISIGALAVREMFSQDVAKHYSFTITSGIAASLILNRVMFGTWFDEETRKHPSSDGYSCVGYTCFTNSLYVIGALCVFSTFVSAYTARKWWKIRQTF